MYADNIRSVMVARSDIAVAALGDVRFPKLHDLWVGQPFPISRIAPYLQPSVTHFTYRGCPAPGLGQALSEHCPRLHDISLQDKTDADRSSAERYMGSLQHFFRHCSLAVRTITFFGEFPDSSASDAVFMHLAQRQALEELDVKRCAPSRCLKAVADMTLQGGTAPFSNLRRLCVWVESQNVKHLVRAAPSVTSLQLHLLDNTCNALAALAALAHLRDLFISYWINVKPASEDVLDGLRRLQELRTLTIRVWESFATPMTDANFNRVILSFTQLRRLKITVYSGNLGLTSASLASIGRHCRQLEELELPGIWDLSTLHDSSLKPLFPKLNVLRLYRAVIRPTDEEGRR
jgi:hypothetical protein